MEALQGDESWRTVMEFYRNLLKIRRSETKINSDMTKNGNNWRKRQKRKSLLLFCISVFAFVVNFF